MVPSPGSILLPSRDTNPSYSLNRTRAEPATSCCSSHSPSTRAVPAAAAGPPKLCGALPVVLPVPLLRLLLGAGCGGVSILLMRGRARLIWTCMSSSENN
jgi:hypothetical protein